MRHTLSVTVENKPGILTRVAGLFARRGYNIESLVVAETENPQISRMTIVVDGDGRIIEQVSKQLHKLINVLKIQDITHEEAVHRELILLRVNADATNRTEILQVAEVFRARIVDMSRASVTIEATGDTSKIEAILTTFRPYGIKEFARTGRLSMMRGK
ncbi:acetolactate synthase small subunit [Heliophilum fasciatum]|uniref:Acetolactate synthase small subunit n=1 Tax=Heliophilum fasciatum TaxID=35700 RepID=A0A4R2RPL1_9FIRM|nr:acetolactate synthase small subunit [Heliophilum fasciatum]MCW2277640.1 acetolactate synthase-1/3 small subunit [Heliophilum fasciatum]TCP64988.1 acetolactate synthase small subunit [Heliophilum fasciatum]